ncbi:hypothetical protein BN168_280049 [Clostridioides difficile CD002]|nr:hypothetical protein HMPREF1123_00969 [Clostridioides difficile 050-P50-2011]EHJ32996.1 hypothetical protein HMPREF1122_00856 [Clostridioides difficile 002-P50-2011]CCL05901.1 hypothetical protein BN168_280049 [Clostridioides difficile CD002]
MFIDSFSLYQYNNLVTFQLAEVYLTITLKVYLGKVVKMGIWYTKGG